MGDEYTRNDYVALPAEAGVMIANEFEPNDSWLAHADPKLQEAAILRWFLTRFEDPAIRVPYDSSEGGYVWMGSGPFDPEDEIQERFSGKVPDDTIAKVVRELHEATGHQWAPIHSPLDYEDMGYGLLLYSEAMDAFSTRMAHLEALANLDVPPGLEQIQLQMIHGAVISTLEATIADTVTAIVLKRDSALRTFVANNADMQKTQMNLSDIFSRYDKITEEVNRYLSDQVWHRLHKLKPMIRDCLEVEVPDIRDVMAQIAIRHDIVHRAGKTKAGNPIALTRDDITKLFKTVRKFVDDFEEALTDKYGL